MVVVKVGGGGGGGGGGGCCGGCGLMSVLCLTSSDLRVIKWRPGLGGGMC